MENKENNKTQEIGSTSDNKEKNEKNEKNNISESSPPIIPEIKETSRTTLLLENDNKTNQNTNKGMYKMGVYVILAIVFGYFITKTDNNKYKIGLIIGFVLFSTFLFNKFFKEPNTVSEDNGTNLIEG